MLPNHVAFWENVSKTRVDILSTTDVEMKCSADMAIGRGPKLKSGVLFISTSIVEEQIEILCLKPPKKYYTVWEHDPVVGFFAYMHRLLHICIQCGVLHIFVYNVVHYPRPCSHPASGAERGCCRCCVRAPALHHVCCNMMYLCCISDVSVVM